MIGGTEDDTEKEFDMKVRNLAGCICMGLMLVACGRKEPVDALTRIQIGDNEIILQQGERVEQNYWNENREAVYTDADGKESYYEDKVLVNGQITIGSNVKEVLDVFEITPGDAMVNREIDCYGDGTTDIVEEEYDSLDFFDEEKVLDARICFGYEKMDGEWTKLSYETLRAVLYGDTDKEKEYLVFEFDFVGNALAGDTDVNERELIDLVVYYR